MEVQLSRPESGDAAFYPQLFSAAIAAAFAGAEPGDFGRYRWLTMTPRHRFMSLTTHFEGARVGYTTHSYYTSFKERP